MAVRSHADWLTQTDERLLELLAADGALARTTIPDRLAAAAPALSVSESTVEDRCDALRDGGLVTESEDGVALTADGRAFLDGRLDLTAEDPDATADLGADGDDGYWTCPDCRWVGDHADLESDDGGDAVCPVCGNDWEYVD